MVSVHASFVTQRLSGSGLMCCCCCCCRLFCLITLPRYATCLYFLFSSILRVLSLVVFLSALASLCLCPQRESQPAHTSGHGCCCYDCLPNTTTTPPANPPPPPSPLLSSPLLIACSRP